MPSALFDTLPPTLFNPLAAHGAPVYGEVLLRLFAATRQSYQPLSREAVLYLVGNVLTNPTALALTAEADDDADNPATDEDDVVTSVRISSACCNMPMPQACLSRCFSTVMAMSYPSRRTRLPRSAA